MSKSEDDVQEVISKEEVEISMKEKFPVEKEGKEIESEYSTTSGPLGKLNSEEISDEVISTTKSENEECSGIERKFKIKSFEEENIEIDNLDIEEIQKCTTELKDLSIEKDKEMHLQLAESTKQNEIEEISEIKD